MVRVSNPNVFAGEICFKGEFAEKVSARASRDFPGKVVGDVAYKTSGLVIKDMPEPVAPRKVVNKKGGESPTGQE